MLFQTFARRVGGSGGVPVLGSDPVPSGAASKANSCALNVRTEGTSGVTFLQRLAVTYVGPAAILPVTLWVYDEGTETWSISGAGNLTPNALTRVDCICPVGQGTGTSSVDLYVRVEDPGGLVNGTYVVLLAPDSSTALSIASTGGPAANVAVTNFPGNQPVTVTNPLFGVLDAADVRVNPATEETLAAFGALLGTISGSVASIDTKTPSLGQAPEGGSVPSVLPPDQETALRDVSDRAARVLGHVVVDSSALPSGAATAANQASEISTLGSIDGKLPALEVGRVPVAANQGTAAASSGGWPVKVTDGTNVAAVKAASTPAAAPDPAAVVALSPNSPLPTGTNTVGSANVLGLNSSGQPQRVYVDWYGSQRQVSDPYASGIYGGNQVVGTFERVSGSFVAYRLDPNRWSSVTSGGGSVTFNATTGLVEIGTNGTSGSYALYIDNRTTIFSGLGSKGTFTFALSASALGAGKYTEWGGFHVPGSGALTGDAVGFYIIGHATTPEWGFFVRRFGFTNRIPQAGWNVDRLDGTGPSGHTVTPANLVNETEYSLISVRLGLIMVGNVVVLALDAGNPATSPFPSTASRIPCIRLGYRHEDTTNNGTPSTITMYEAYGCVYKGFGQQVQTTPYARSKTTITAIPAAATRPLLTIRAATLVGALPNGFGLWPTRCNVRMNKSGSLLLYYGTLTDIVLTGAAFASPANAPLSTAEIDVAATLATVGAGAWLVDDFKLVQDQALEVDLSKYFGLNNLALGIRGDGTQTVLSILALNDGPGSADAVISIAWNEGLSI